MLLLHYLVLHLALLYLIVLYNFHNKVNIVDKVCKVEHEPVTSHLKIVVLDMILLLKLYLPLFLEFDLVNHYNYIFDVHLKN